ncbi:hypothetical protein VaNZ11_001352 [Volvox africanus]|uniref:GPI transamidase subunit PIG-U n=1 Tax=Volvox africanus TaxID=51714 RepID=A0ABQ5RPM5_9CHLO|nr:hypothetical protein VaNZ11_001352 [Volvox africanus]
MLHAAFVGTSARVLLAWSSIGASLAWRIEVSTASNSNLELREGLALLRLGVSPYSGTSCRTPPLALWLYGALADHDLLYILPNTILDLLAASLLYRLASYLLNYSRSRGKSVETSEDTPVYDSVNGDCFAVKGSFSGFRSALPSALAWCYLLNPFTLAASAGGTTSALENLALVTALYGACTAQPALAALGLAAASYMSLHAAVLLLPVACLLAYGPEDVVTPLRLLGPCHNGSALHVGAPGVGVGAALGSGDGGTAGGEDSPGKAKAALVKEGKLLEEQQQKLARNEMDRAAVGEVRDSPSGRATLETRSLPQCSAPLPTPPSLPILPWRQLSQCTLLAASILSLLVCASDLYLLSVPRRMGIGVHADADNGNTTTCILGAAKQLITPPSTSTGTAAGEVARRLVAAGESLASCWAVRVYSSQVLLDDATPNIGQWWYLAMEAFDDTKTYIRVMAHSLLFALAPPLAMRLGVRRPLALFLIQMLCLGFLKPYPSVADLGLMAPLLLLLGRQQLAALRLRLLLPASLAMLWVLGPAMQRMWLSYESANSNFFYSITLLYGLWQVVLLGQVLGLTLWVDRLARGKERLLEGRLDERRQEAQMSSAAPEADGAKS